MRPPSPPAHTPPTRHKGDVSYSYILMVQHLIERCLLLYMDRDDCVKALAKYAHVKPVITLTVWKELEKENKDFFTAYARQRQDSEARALSKALDDATTKLCQQKLDECSQMLQSSSSSSCKHSSSPLQHSRAGTTHVNV